MKYVFRHTVNQSSVLKRKHTNNTCDVLAKIISS